MRLLLNVLREYCRSPEVEAANNLYGITANPRSRLG